MDATSPRSSPSARNAGSYRKPSGSVGLFLLFFLLELLFFFLLVLRGLAAHDALGDLGEVLVGLLLLLESLLEQLGGFLLAEHLGHGAGRAVGRDLVVLDLLGGGDEAGVEHGRFRHLA